MNNVTIGGMAGGQAFTYYETIGGGLGGGLDALDLQPRPGEQCLSQRAYLHDYPDPLVLVALAAWLAVAMVFDLGCRHPVDPVYRTAQPARSGGRDPVGLVGVPLWPVVGGAAIRGGVGHARP